MTTIHFIVNKTPAPPAPTVLSYDSGNSENFNNTDESFTETGDPGQGASAITNGSLLVAWEEYCPSEFDYSNCKVNLKNIDLVGSNNWATQYPGLHYVNGAGSMSMAKLVNGNIALVYADQRSGTVPVNGAVVSSSGSVIVSETAIDASRGFSNGTGCVALNNGNFVAIWPSASAGATYLRVYGPTMSAVSGVITVDASNEADGIRAAVLSNNNFVVIYKRGDGNRLCIYQPDGTEDLNTTLEAGNTDAVLNSVVPTSDGGFVVSFGIKNGSFDNVIKLRKYSSTGVAGTTVTVSDPAAADPGGGLPWNSWYATQAFLMDNGNIGLAGWSSGSKTLYCWAYDQDLTEVQSLTSLSTIAQTIDSYRQAYAAQFGSGKYGFVMQRQGPSGTKVYLDVLTT